MSVTKVSIIVPSKSGGYGTVNIPDHNALVRVMAERFSNIFGGATAYCAEGFWINPDTGALVSEHVTEVVSYVTNVDPDLAEEFIYDQAKQLQKEANQDSVMYKINDNPYFYSP